MKLYRPLFAAVMMLPMLCNAPAALGQTVRPVALVVSDGNGDDAKQARDFAAQQAAAEHFRKMVAAAAASLWVPWQTSKAHILQSIGMQNKDRTLLQQALDAYDKALSADIEDSEPLLWSDIQVDIGDTLLAMSYLGTAPDIDLLHRSVDAYHLSLSGLDPADQQDLHPWYVASTRLELALVRLNLVKPDLDTLHELVSLCGDLLDRPQGLTTYGRVDVAFNRAHALNAIANLTQNPDDSLSAIRAFEETLVPGLRDSDTRHWAYLNMGMGSALARLATLTGGEVSLAYSRRAIAAWSAATELLTRDLHEDEWAILQNDIGFEMVLIGDAAHDTSQYDAAIPILREAMSLQADKPDRLPFTQDSLCHALLGAGRAHGDRNMLLEAKAICELSIKGAKALGEDTGETQGNLDAINAALAQLG